MTLTEFLTARLDEDEAVARAAGGRRLVIFENYGCEDSGACCGTCGVGVSIDESDVAYLPTSPEPIQSHVSRHDPARVLREVEAKRRIVGRHEEVPVAPGRPETTCVEDGWIDGWPCPTLRHLASVYADHPDYDGAWRP